MDGMSRVSLYVVFCVVSWLLIPYASGPVMRYHVCLRFLFLLGQVIQEEVDKDSIDFRIRVDLQYLPAQKLDSPDTATAYLHLPGVAGIDDLQTANLVFERRTIPYHS
jgi:hypothetical protein